MRKRKSYVMKILLLSDTEDKALWDHYRPDRLAGIDLILSCGDLRAEYLEFLVTMTNLPLFYVHGNHDQGYATRPPEGCLCIEDHIESYQGFRIMGLGGSMRYHPDSTCMYTEQEMTFRLWKLGLSMRRGGVDLLLTHAPIHGYGDLPDLAHRGFSCFDRLLSGQHIPYMAFGHVHKSYGKFERTLCHPSGTLLINAWQSCILDTETGEVRDR